MMFSGIPGILEGVSRWNLKKMFPRDSNKVSGVLEEVEIVPGDVRM